MQMHFYSILSSKFIGRSCTVGLYVIDTMEQVPIGQNHVVDMDLLEQKWTKCGYLLFYYEGLTNTNEKVSMYFIMVSTPLPSTHWFQLIENNDHLDNTLELYAKPFLFLLKKRFTQRLSTRKIIKEYKQEAKRRAANSMKECEEEILLTMLERVMPIKKGEEIYWFRDYEQALLEVAMEETKEALEYKFRPGNEGFDAAKESFMELLNKQSC